MNSPPSKSRGSAIIVTKGKHAGRHGVIDRVVNHSWYEIRLLPNDWATLHTAYFRVAVEGEQPPDPLAHLM